MRVGHRNLDIHVMAPACDPERLLFHLREVIGEHFKGDRPVWNGRQHSQRKAFVISDPGFSHQRGISSEAADQRMTVQSAHLGKRGAVGKNLNF